MYAVTHSLEPSGMIIKASLIRDAYQGMADNRVWDQYQHELQKMHYEKVWIACDCVDNPDDPPLLFVRKTPNGKYTLVRMTKRTAHAEDCLFRFEESEHALLLQLIKKSGLHCFHPGDLGIPVKDKYARVRQAFMDVRREDQEPVTHPGALFRWAKEHTTGTRSLLSAIDAYDKGKVYVRIKDYNYSVPVSGHISDLLSDTDTPSVGPLLLLAQVHVHDKKPVIKKGWVVPAQDKGTLIPVYPKHRTTWTVLLREIGHQDKKIPGLISIESILPGNRFFGHADLLAHLENGQTLTIQVKGNTNEPKNTDLYHAYDAKGDGATKAFISALYGMSRSRLEA